MSYLRLQLTEVAARDYANSENHTLRRQGAGRPTTEPVAAE